MIKNICKNINVVFRGDWQYSHSVECTHGMDYVYKRRTITAYRCNSCSFYSEADSYEYETRCSGA